MNKRIKKKLENRLYNFHYSDFKSKYRTTEDMITELKMIIQERRNNVPLTEVEVGAIKDFCFDVVYIPVSWEHIPHIHRRTARNLYAIIYLLDGGIICEQKNKKETA